MEGEKRLKMQWNKQVDLESSKHWIDKGEWQGTAHFRKHNSFLYEYLYRTFGMDIAFEKNRVRLRIV